MWTYDIKTWSATEDTKTLLTLEWVGKEYWLEVETVYLLCLKVLSSAVLLESTDFS